MPLRGNTRRRRNRTSINQWIVICLSSIPGCRRFEEKCCYLIVFRFYFPTFPSGIIFLGEEIAIVDWLKKEITLKGHIQILLHWNEKTSQKKKRERRSKTRQAEAKGPTMAHRGWQPKKKQTCGAHKGNACRCKIPVRTGKA